MADRSTFYHQIVRQPAELVPAGGVVVVAARRCSGSPSATRIGGDAGGRRRRRPRSALARRRLLSASARTSRATSSSSRSAARSEVDETDGAAAHERRPRDGDRGQRPDAQGLRHRRHGAERVRDRPRPEARLGRDHDRPAREARPRGAPGRHRPRAVARPQLRHPVLAARRGAWSARSRCWPTSSCASRSGAAAGRRSRDRDSGGGGAQAIIFVVAIVLAILAPIISRFVQLAVSRQREYLADASSVELTRNPHGLERALAKIAGDQEVLEVANRATQHLYFTNPIKKFEERSSGLMSTHPAIVDRINRLRELTGEPPLERRDAAALAGLE